MDDNAPFPIPDEPTPEGGGSGAGRAFSVRRYGMLQWGDLFSTRQKVMLLTMRSLTAESENLQTALALVLTRQANAGASLCRWNRVGEKHEGVYARQALPLVWDFSEVNPFSGATGGYAGALEWVSRVVDAWPGSKSGQVEQADATKHATAGSVRGNLVHGPAVLRRRALCGSLGLLPGMAQANPARKLAAKRDPF